jgi:uncharacterized protein with FMN-binding domain
MNRTIPFAVAATASLVGPLGVPIAAIAQAADATPAAHVAATKRYVGATADMKWGPVTVRIWVSGRKIVNLHATYPTERRRSQEINNRSGPTLRSETLRAQSAHVRTVSGATMSSRAFIQSLRSALAKAHI